jgi:LPS O-antigen subunit length determinant protein (WzzB/FepE family)
MFEQDDENAPELSIDEDGNRVKRFRVKKSRLKQYLNTEQNKERNTEHAKYGFDMLLNAMNVKKAL